MKTKLGAKFALLAFGLTVGVGVLEVGLRLARVRPQTVMIAQLGGEVPSGENVVADGLPDELLYVRTPTGRRLKRSTRALVRNHSLSKRDIEIVTNSLGFRHAEIAAKERDEFRLLVLGDSITFGDYVNAAETYPAQIEKALQRTWLSAGQKLQVINAGVGAVDLQNMLAILLETGLDVEPDLVLVGLYLNDAYHSPVLEVTRLPAILAHSALLSLVANRIDVLRSRQLSMGSQEEAEVHFRQARDEFMKSHTLSEGDFLTDPHAFNKMVYEAFSDWGYAWSPRYWEKIESLLSIVQQVTQSRGSGLAVVLLPVRPQMDAHYLYDAPQREFATVMERLSIPHLDLLPTLRKQPAGTSDQLFYDHCHYTPAGNKLVGETIAGFVKPLLH